MNAEAFGGYCSLLVEAWLDPSGSVPADPEELPVLARMGKSSWARYEKAILSLFEEDEGRLYSPIVEEARAKIAKKSQIGKAAVEAREKRKAEKYRQLEPTEASNDDRTIIERSSNDDRTMIERLSKEKEKEKEKENPPSNPSPAGSGTRKATSSKQKPKALQKGDPKNAESWEAFDAVYPRPDNGRKLERADARLTWDLLAEDGEDMAKIVEGARRYREWIEALDKRKYVAMMTTWLNQRRWEESYLIDPSSEEGKLIQAKKEAETRERRSAHQAKFQADYEAYVEALAEAGIAAPGFYDEWKAEAEATLEKRREMGLAGAVRMAEKNLSDPEAAREDQLRRWREKNAVPTFWEWDAETNPEGFR
jgi:uncharacterized protein YdaU (DUF1376 family)